MCKGDGGRACMSKLHPDRLTTHLDLMQLLELLHCCHFDTVCMCVYVCECMYVLKVQNFNSS